MAETLAEIIAAALPQDECQDVEEERILEVLQQIHPLESDRKVFEQTLHRFRELLASRQDERREDAGEEERVLEVLEQIHPLESDLKVFEQTLHRFRELLASRRAAVSSGAPALRGRGGGSVWSGASPDGDEVRTPRRRPRPLRRLRPESFSSPSEPSEQKVAYGPAACRRPLAEMYIPVKNVPADAVGQPGPKRRRRLVLL